MSRGGGGGATELSGLGGAGRELGCGGREQRGAPPSVVNASPRRSGHRTTDDTRDGQPPIPVGALRSHASPPPQRALVSAHAGATPQPAAIATTTAGDHAANHSAIPAANPAAATAPNPALLQPLNAAQHSALAGARSNAQHGAVAGRGGNMGATLERNLDTNLDTNLDRAGVAPREIASPAAAAREVASPRVGAREISSPLRGVRVAAVQSDSAPAGAAGGAEAARAMAAVGGVGGVGVGGDERGCEGGEGSACVGALLAAAGAALDDARANGGGGGSAGGGSGGGACADMGTGAAGRRRHTQQMLAVLRSRGLGGHGLENKYRGGAPCGYQGGRVSGRAGGGDGLGGGGRLPAEHSHRLPTAPVNGSGARAAADRANASLHARIGGDGISAGPHSHLRPPASVNGSGATDGAPVSLHARIGAIMAAVGEQHRRASAALVALAPPAPWEVVTTAAWCDLRGCLAVPPGKSGQGGSECGPGGGYRQPPGVLSARAMDEERARLREAMALWVRLARALAGGIYLKAA